MIKTWRKVRPRRPADGGARRYPRQRRRCARDTWLPWATGRPATSPTGFVQTIIGGRHIRRGTPLLIIELVPASSSC
jgi:hypothetical protein